MVEKLNIYLDIDDVIFKWFEAFATRFNSKVLKSWSNSNLVKRRLGIVAKEKEFWLGLPIKNKPNFTPKGYVSARGIPTAWTKESLKINSIPGRNNINQVYWGESKLELLKQLKCDIFVDDKVATFRELNKNGVFCLLMDAPHNQKVKTNHRVYDLDINNIMNLWHKLK